MEGANAFGPPPTKVLHWPQLSCATTGTVAPWPAAICRTEKAFCVVLDGRFTVNGGVRTCPSMAICALWYTAGSLPKVSCRSWLAAAQLAGRAETVTKAEPPVGGATDTPILAPDVEDPVAVFEVIVGLFAVAAPPTTGPADWVLTAVGEGDGEVAVGMAAGVATGSGPPTRVDQLPQLSTTISGTVAA